MENKKANERKRHKKEETVWVKTPMIPHILSGWTCELDTDNNIKHNGNHRLTANNIIISMWDGNKLREREREEKDVECR